MSQLGISRTALDLIKSFEGFRAKAAALSAGGYTIGYGHKATAREGLQITREQAEELLRWDLRPVEDAVRQSCFAPLTQQQFDALVSFAFNIGVDNYRHSDVLKHLNQGEPIAAAIAISAWRRANFNGKNIIVDALIRRRSAEVSLFLETVGPRPAAPTSVIEPKLDYSASLLIPKTSEIRQAVPISGSGDFTLAQDDNPSTTEKVEINNALQAFPDTQMPEEATQNQSDNLQIVNVTEEIKAANELALQANPPANDLVGNAKAEAPNDLAAKTKPLDAFKGQGVELKAPPPMATDYSTYIMWAIFGAGLVATVIGLVNLSALGFFSGSSEQTTIGENNISYWLMATAGAISAVVSGYFLVRSKKYL
jgi:GH24 family phage-related lysozyme (muramidase)